MILPDKYITLENSIVFVGGIIIKVLGQSRMKPEILLKKSKNYFNRKKLYFNSENFFNSLIFLNMCNVLNIDNKGELYNENFESKN